MGRGSVGPAEATCSTGMCRQCQRGGLGSAGMGVHAPSRCCSGAGAGRVLGTGGTGVLGVNCGEVVSVYLPLHSLMCPSGVLELGRGMSCRKCWFWFVPRLGQPLERACSAEAGRRGQGFSWGCYPGSWLEAISRVSPGAGQTRCALNPLPAVTGALEKGISWTRHVQADSFL